VGSCFFEKATAIFLKWSLMIEKKNLIDLHKKKWWTKKISMLDCLAEKKTPKSHCTKKRVFVDIVICWLPTLFSSPKVMRFPFYTPHSRCLFVQLRFHNIVHSSSCLLVCSFYAYILIFHSYCVNKIHPARDFLKKKSSVDSRTLPKKLRIKVFIAK
jgi:hypothetical protein